MKSLRCTISIIILLVFSACWEKTDEYATLDINLNTGLSVGNPRHVYLRVFDSDFKLIGRNNNDLGGYAIIPSGSSSKVINIVNFDSNYNPTSGYAHLKEGDYFIHLAINDDGDTSGAKANFEIGEKVALKTFKISTLTKVVVNIGPADIQNSVLDSVSLTSTQNISGPKNAYCLWLPSKVLPLSGYFLSYQQLSVSSGSFSGTSGTVNTKYSNWFGLVPNTTYSLYCFVDVDGNGFVSYNVDYEGGNTVNVGSGGGNHTITLNKVLH